ncbi:hypothetical protein TWF281_004826 [Arthrobotrys megalospora]
MDGEQYLPDTDMATTEDVVMADKELESSPYITTPSTPRASITYQPVSNPPEYPAYPLDTTQPLDNNIIRYSPSQTQKLAILSLIQAVSLGWWMLAIIFGIYYTPTEDDYDSNEHGSTAAFQKQLIDFRVSLVGLVPAFIISLLKLLILPRLFEKQRNTEESRRLASDIDGAFHYDPYEKSELMVGRWWMGYIKFMKIMEVWLHVMGLVVTIWLAVGGFRGYIKPRGPFDDAICAFSDPAAQGIVVPDTIGSGAK